MTAELDVLLEEYKALKAEQCARIGIRDNLVYAAIVAVAAVVGGAPFGGRLVPLLLPPVCTVLGWTFLANDRKVSAIGAYLRGELGPRLAGLAGAGALGWEVAHRSVRGRRSHKRGQVVVDLLVFAVPSVAALLAFWLGGSHPGMLVAASAVEAVLVVGFVWQVASVAGD